MGEQPSKPVKPMTDEKVVRIMNQHPDAVLLYFEENRGVIEKYVEENFWEEDVERWLEAIRNRSPKEQLQIRKVDFKVTKNAALNETSLYENKTLVIRRASEFEVDVHFGNRSFDPQRDDISIVFGIGASPSAATGTKFSCVAKTQIGPAKEWSCAISSVGDKVMSLKVKVPPTAIIGRYRVSVDVVSGVQSGREKSTFKASSVIVLFNPFSKDDTVYMENESFRNEYVLNDEGFINVGSYGFNGSGVRKRPWDFAQFDEGVLDAVLLMIENDSRMKDKPIKTLKKCSSPVFVSRILAAMVNCDDDKGVLRGRWADEFPGGKRPGYWGSSADILLEWEKNQLAPVKYGQCWVFSGVLTTALRAVGIPARSVTNFESAHDTDRNETIDIYIDAKKFGRVLDETSDSVWNFHVWNEGYFRRPDLPSGYDGWQVIDATPQEASDVVDSNVGGKPLMQCGPAPVKAVKEGEINIGYDTAFVFSEVNADKVYWYVDANGDEVYKPTVHKAAVGKFIGTKAVGRDETENILSQYKYAEGSEQERKAFNRAYSLGTQEHSSGSIDIKSKLVAPAFEVTIDGVDGVAVGDDIVAKIKVKNISEETHEIGVNIAMNSKGHIGKIHALLKQTEEKSEVKPGEAKEFSLELQSDEYVASIADNYAVNVTVIVKSANHGNAAFEELSTTLQVPDCMDIAVPNSMYGGDEGTFDVTFTNKFPIKLTNGVIEIQGRGFSGNKIKIGKPLLPNQTYTVKDEKITPRLGWRRLYGTVVFESAEVKGLKKNMKVKLEM